VPSTDTCAAADSAIVAPTATWAGFADTPSTTGQTLIVPFTMIEPVWGGS